MRTRLFLFIAFVVVPIVEIALLIALGNAFGFWPTFALVVATAFLGSWLVSLQGRATYDQVRTQLNSGQIPGSAIAHGGMILIAGAFLLTPGLLTDALGFLLLIPAVREMIRKRLMNRYVDRWTLAAPVDVIDLP
jgi:UPF0716 protein FxsA